MTATEERVLKCAEELEAQYQIQKAQMMRNTYGQTAEQASAAAQDVALADVNREVARLNLLNAKDALVQERLKAKSAA